MNSSDIDLGELQEFAVLKYETEYQTFLLKRSDWQSQLHQELPPFDAEAYEHKKSVARELMQDYERFENRQAI